MAHLIDPGRAPEMVAANTMKSLEGIQGLVEGYVEVVALPVTELKLNGAVYTRPLLLVNEDGVRLKMPPNRFATHLAGRLIVGPVVLVSASEI